MPQPHVIVCERTGRWALALRQAFARQTAPRIPPSIQVRETRSLAECRQELQAAPASFVALELAAPRLGETLQFLFGLEREFPLARAAVLAGRELAGYEWLARELGAVEFRVSTRFLDGLAEAARRHLARCETPDVPLTEQVLATLPFGPSAHTPTPWRQP